jgi:rhomboid family GlyGly-CTERM serine protease
MPGGGPNRAAELAHALQWDRGRWIWLLSIVVFFHVLLALGDGVTLSLRYERAAIASGAWWRLLSAHVVHLDLHHLVLNELGLVLLWSLFASDFDAVDWAIIVLSGALAISSGLWWLSPSVGWYVGASGVLHAIMAAGCAAHLAARSWDRWILVAGFSAKLAFEQYQHLTHRSAPLIVVDAHLYGAAAGFAVGAALCWRMAIIRHRHQH